MNLVPPPPQHPHLETSFNKTLHSDSSTLYASVYTEAAPIASQFSPESSQTKFPKSGLCIAISRLTEQVVQQNNRLKRTLGMMLSGKFGSRNKLHKAMQSSVLSIKKQATNNEIYSLCYTETNKI